MGSVCFPFVLILVQKIYFIDADYHLNMMYFTQKAKLTGQTYWALYIQKKFRLHRSDPGDPRF